MCEKIKLYLQKYYTSYSVKQQTVLNVLFYLSGQPFTLIFN